MREAGVTCPQYYESKSISQVMERADEFDIIHNHLGFQLFPYAKFINKPIVTTLHGAFVCKDDFDFYNEHREQSYISISDYQRKGAPDLNYISTVYNGINVNNYPLYEKPNLKDPYFIFLGRVSIEKGTHLAVELAKKVGIKLIIAGKISDVDMEYHETMVKPHIDGKNVIYVGEVGLKAKCELLGNAIAALHTVTWPEPFGLVLAESNACGTPVLALRDGSIPEVIKHCETGFVEDNIENLYARVKDISKIDRKKCREHVCQNFTSEIMTNNYLKAYEKVLNTKPVNNKNIAAK
jgi:glycosyltransferase involved in cell wall biosynthesis